MKAPFTLCRLHPLPSFRESACHTIPAPRLGSLEGLEGRGSLRRSTFQGECCLSPCPIMISGLDPICVPLHNSNDTRVIKYLEVCVISNLPVVIRQPINKWLFGICSLAFTGTGYLQLSEADSPHLEEISWGQFLLGTSGSAPSKAGGGGNQKPTPSLSAGRHVLLIPHPGSFAAPQTC